MLPSFDVFKLTQDGWRWCSDANSLTDAKAKAQKLADQNSEFVILNQETQERITFTPQKDQNHQTG